MNGGFVISIIYISLDGLFSIQETLDITNPR